MIVLPKIVTKKPERRLTSDDISARQLNYPTSQTDTIPQLNSVSNYFLAGKLKEKVIGADSSTSRAVAKDSNYALFIHTGDTLCI